MKLSYDSRIAPTLLIALTCALVVIVGSRKEKNTPDLDLTSKYANNMQLIAKHEGEYVGAAACAECHRKECDAQSRTFHAGSLHALTDVQPGPISPPVGAITNTPLEVRADGGRRFLELPVGRDLKGHKVSGSPGVIATLEYAIGAGKVAVAYSWHDHSIGNSGLTKEVWIPRAKQWREAALCTDVGLIDQGIALAGPQVADCNRCHSLGSANAPPLSPVADKGVGCESCHGPGGAHIQAARLGLSEPHIELTRSTTAKEIDAACGICHRIERNAPPVAPSLTVGGQAAFSGHALAFARSRCFLKSDGKLSCITCHDPHTNLAAAPSYYENICMSCHTPPGARLTGLPMTQTVRAKSCPVSQSSGCVSCHLPRHGQLDPRTAFQPMTVTSHYIGIYGKAGEKTGERRLRERAVARRGY